MTLTEAVAVSPPGSAAVMVTVALPGATAVMVKVVPEIVAVATPGLDELAEYDSASPFSSVKHTLTVVDSPALIVCCGIGPQASGARGFSHAAIARASKPVRAT